MQGREVSEKFIAPNICKLHTGEMKLEQTFPHTKEFRAVGIPEEFGGMAPFTGIVDSVIVHHTLAYGSASAASFFDGHDLFVLPIILAGTQQQKEHYLPPLASGEKVGCYGLSDLNSGSGVANMSTLLFTDNGSGVYTLNGSKTFVTNAPIADYAVVFAKDRNNGEIRKNITAFIVPAQKDGSAGFAAEKPMDKLGWRASHTSIISLDDVKATAEDVLGKVGEGFKIAVITLAYGRLKVAAEALGLMERAYDETLAFVSQRKASDGGPLAEKDVARYQLAEMAQVIQATRDTVYNTALLAETMEDGKVAPFSLEAAQVKSFAGSNLQWVANRALELHGGYGFTLEYPVSVIKADSSLYMIGEGANNVLLVSVGSQLLGK